MRKIAKMMFVLLSGLMFTFTAFGQDAGLGNAFSHYNLVRLGGAQALADVRAGKTLKIQSPDGLLELQLENYDMKSPNYRGTFSADKNGIQKLPEIESQGYRGRAVGFSNSTVRVILNGKSIEGMVKTPRGWVYFEPANRYSKAQSADMLVVFRGEDSKVKPAPFSESKTPLMVARNNKFDKPAAKSGFSILPANMVKVVDHQRRVFEVFVTADYEFLRNHSSSVTMTGQYMTNTLVLVDGLFEAELNVSVVKVGQMIWKTQDPFEYDEPETYGEDFYSDILYDYRDWMNAYGSSTDAAVLFTGDYEGAGAAFYAAGCNPNFHYAWVGDLGRYGDENAPAVQHQKGLTGHEMAHLLGASDMYSPAHEILTGQPVPEDCLGDNIMRSPTPYNSFCPSSKIEVTNWIHGAMSGCLSIEF